MSRELRLKPNSRLVATPLLQEPDSNVYYFGVWGRIDFPVTNDDKTHTITKRDIINWPGLSNDYYGTPHQAWVIWTANNISDPWSITPGTRVRIPSITNVNQVLASITKDAE